MNLLSKCDSIKWRNMTKISRKRMLVLFLACCARLICLTFEFAQLYNARTRTTSTNKHAHRVHISFELLSLHFEQFKCGFLYSNPYFLPSPRGRTFHFLKFNTQLKEYCLSHQPALLFVFAMAEFFDQMVFSVKWIVKNVKMDQLKFCKTKNDCDNDNANQRHNELFYVYTRAHITETPYTTSINSKKTKHNKTKCEFVEKSFCTMGVCISIWAVHLSAYLSIYPYPCFQT